MKKQSKTKNVVAIVAIVLCLFLGISLILPRLFKGSSAEGEKGDTGNGIHSIAKTATNGLTDTYTITFTDGSTYTYTLTNGEKGETGATGATGNGIQSIEKTATEGLVDTYTITFTNGSIYTYTVTNGADGESISGGTTIPAEAIIDVDELPQELDVYTLMNGEKNVFIPSNPLDSNLPLSFIIVDTLPVTGIVSIDVQCVIYEKATNTAYLYADDKWYSLSQVFPDVNILYITNPEEATEVDVLYIVVKENLENINTQAFYRVPKATNGAGYIYMPGMGAITLPQFAQSMGVPTFEEIVVNELPATGKPTDTVNMSAVYAYTNLADGVIYYYYSANSDSRWYPFSVALSSLQQTTIPDNGFVDSIDEMTEMGIYVLRTETEFKLYHYKNGWHEVGSGGANAESSFVENGWKLIRNYSDIQPILFSGKYTELMIAYQPDILDSNCPTFSSPIPKETFYRGTINAPEILMQVGEDSSIGFRLTISETGEFIGLYQIGEEVGQLTADNYIDNPEWGSWSWELWYKYDVSSQSGGNMTVELSHLSTDSTTNTITFA